MWASELLSYTMGRAVSSGLWRGRLAKLTRRWGNFGRASILFDYSSFSSAVVGGGFFFFRFFLIRGLYWRTRDGYSWVVGQLASEYRVEADVGHGDEIVAHSGFGIF